MDRHPPRSVAVILACLTLAAVPCRASPQRLADHPLLRGIPKASIGPLRSPRDGLAVICKTSTEAPLIRSTSSSVARCGGVLNTGDILDVCSDVFTRRVLGTAKYDADQRTGRVRDHGAYNRSEHIEHLGQGMSTRLRSRWPWRGDSRSTRAEREREIAVSLSENFGVGIRADEVSLLRWAYFPNEHVEVVRIGGRRGQIWGLQRVAERICWLEEAPRSLDPAVIVPLSEGDAFPAEFRQILPPGGFASKRKPSGFIKTFVKSPRTAIVDATRLPGGTDVLRYWDQVSGVELARTEQRAARDWSAAFPAYNGGQDPLRPGVDRRAALIGWAIADFARAQMTPRTTRATPEIRRAPFWRADPARQLPLFQASLPYAVNEDQIQVVAELYTAHERLLGIVVDNRDFYRWHLVWNPELAKRDVASMGDNHPRRSKRRQRHGDWDSDSPELLNSDGTLHRALIDWALAN